MDMDRGEYDACTYCGRTIFPDVAECPYCHAYTDGKGPLGLNADEPRRFPKIFILAAWLVILAFLLPALIYLYRWLTPR